MEDQKINNVTILDKAIAFAQIVHKEDKRENGDSYFSHLAAVAQGVDTQPEKAVGFLHDCVEMHPDCLPDLWREFPAYVVDAVLAISRRGKEEKYVDYLRRVMQSSLALDVKIADIKHNLLDQKPGNRKDKYELALEMLERRKQKL